MAFILPIIFALFLSSAVHAEPMESQVILNISFRSHVPWLPEDALKAANIGNWKGLLAALDSVEQSKLDEADVADLAYLKVLANLKGTNIEAARELLPAMESAKTAPHGHRVLLWLLASEPTSGLADLALSVSQESSFYPAVLAKRGDILDALGETEKALEAYQGLSELEAKVPEVPYGMLKLAQSAEGDQAYKLYRTAWAMFPRSAVAAEVADGLAGFAGRGPTWQERGVRAERLMFRGEFKSTIAEADRALKGVKETKDEDACRVLYVRGRSYYKTNQLSTSITAFTGVGDRCKGVSDHYGASSLYLKGKAEFRTRRYSAAAVTFRDIAEDFPKHSMADDGLLEAGIAYLEADDTVNARIMWRRAVSNYPDGDMTPQAAWRLAWSYYVGGETDEALAVVDNLASKEVVSDWEHIAGAHYWAARWRLYPDHKNPSVASQDGARVAEAVLRWKRLCELYPDSFYAILGFSRLVEVAAEEATSFNFKPKPFHETKGDQWIVRLSTYEAPAYREGVSLARLGLITAARESWSRLTVSELSGDEMALMIELRIANGDWLYAHNAFRQYLKGRPPVTHGVRAPSIIRIAYPDRYWSEVQVATKGDTMESRFFHALVREESNFNSHIVSFAGAIGLSQLMPRTAEQTAGWLGMSVTTTALRDPATNLKIGAHYLDRVLNQVDGNPYLSLAAYNAGPGRVSQWKGRWGNIPTDEYIEQIPFKETRGYVKRVMGTWQLMRWHFDKGDPFVNLSKFNHHVEPVED